MLLPRLLFAATSLRAPRQFIRCSASYAATDALYLGDTSLLETTATVLGVEESEKGWTAVLDATCFHPQGGGQPSDVGTLGDANGERLCRRPRRAGRRRLPRAGPGLHAVGDAVACRVDAEHRLRSARTHSAGHLIDVAMQRCGVDLEPTKGYHWATGSRVEYSDANPNADDGRRTRGAQASCRRRSTLSSPRTRRRASARTPKARAS